ncbi:hypothetical protein [Rhizobium grahamii]|uniref:Holin n=1 Tax=Rhizobium grahamii CCGE 502 TaxID=990285 RepID=S3HIQ5_9HYPH|nr:hypothetical protein [Rhizobium grahamii]EPE98627.1 hypothetical protein RGCCGE502_09380 [Rhizobium grahamii CCGE 502]
MNSTKITNYTFIALAVLSSLVGGLQLLDWSAFLTKDQTIAVMSFLSSFGAVVKFWVASAEFYAKQLVAAQTAEQVTQ